MKKLFVTGGCGYVGSLMIQSFLKDYTIKNIDTQWFGNKLEKNKNLTNLKEDIRNLSGDFIDKNTYAVVHLANIANDPSVELDQTLSWEVNVLAAKNLIEKSIKAGVKKFIYASSGSVYGVKNEMRVTEDLDLVPISAYNKTKMICERLLLSYKDKIEVYIVRPATVCGLSPRMRFDVSVNMLTLQALKNKKITIMGGSQTRPNIHINDMIGVYEHILSSDIKPGTYNAGFENISILDLGNKIKNKIDCEIKIIESNDPRSYRQCSDKLIETGFRQKFNIDDAIDQISDAFFNKKIIDDDSCYTVKWMKDKVING
jgi:nucleoside-diphosphate-sugar epimerase|tara:strand:+ start:558 stop:1502 length:945 start_codon:yes stop_codon:yes gene_type:complete